MGAVPVAELMDLPDAYGKAETTLGWEGVRARLTEAAHYWLATVRPDGRPHVVPLDGLWIDDRWYFGGTELSKAKYGYGPPPSVYEGGVWCLTPQRVLSREQFPRDATRFVF
jgi:hypothetical protein